MFSAPDFVTSLEDGDYVYFFFREQAVEYINCGKVRKISGHLLVGICPQSCTNEHHLTLSFLFFFSLGLGTTNPAT